MRIPDDINYEIPFPVTDEMNRFINLLNQNDIEWFDNSDCFFRRTHIPVNDKIVSVIIGYTSYGSDEGLLEISVPDSEYEEGYLTAEEAMEQVTAYIQRVNKV